MCTQSSAFPTTFTSRLSGTGVPYSASTALGSAMKRAFRASSFQQAVNSWARAFFCSDMVFLHGRSGPSFQQAPVREVDS